MTEESGGPDESLMALEAINARHKGPNEGIAAQVKAGSHSLPDFRAGGEGRRKINAVADHGSFARGFRLVNFQSDRLRYGDNRIGPPPLLLGRVPGGSQPLSMMRHHHLGSADALAEYGVMKSRRIVDVENIGLTPSQVRGAEDRPDRLGGILDEVHGQSQVSGALKERPPVEGKEGHLVPLATLSIRQAHDELLHPAHIQAAQNVNDAKREFSGRSRL
jgi:hypothetical protein